MLIIDDIMQTGNTMKAAEELVSSIPGSEIAATFTIYEVLNLKGASKLDKKHVSAIQIDTLKS